MAGQKRSHSFAETALNILIGYIVALLSQLIILPMFGIHIGLKDNILICLYFTVISVIRSYTLRRVFNKVMIRGWK